MDQFELRLRLLKQYYDQEMQGIDRGINLDEFSKSSGATTRQVVVALKDLVDRDWLKGEYVGGTDVPVVMGITSAGREAVEEFEGGRSRPSIAGSTIEASHGSEADPKRVFVIHGRNEELRTNMFAFLRAIGLEPIEWSQAVALTRKASPYIGDIIDAAFRTAQALIVLLSPDDEARLRSEFQKSDDPPYERQFTPQPRQNVLFEAGMAFGYQRERTVIVKVGDLRPFSDILGRHEVRLTNEIKQRKELANRLRNAGCAVDLTGNDWLIAGDFTVGSSTTGLNLSTATEKQTSRAQPVPNVQVSERLKEREKVYAQLSRLIAKMIRDGRPSILQNVAVPPGRATLRVLETTFKEIDKIFDDKASVIESAISYDWDHTCQELMKHYGGAYVEYDLDLDNLRAFVTKLDEELKSIRAQLG